MQSGFTMYSSAATEISRIFALTRNYRLQESDPPLVHQVWGHLHSPIEAKASGMRRFKSERQAQRCLGVHAIVPILITLRLFTPWGLEKAIAEWVDHYNHGRYHESLDNVTPADVFEGRRNEILDQRAPVKARTMTKRKIHNLRLAG